MPRIFDNLASETSLLPALRETLDLSSRADFCVGYFNLRGWGELAPHVDDWSDGDGPCRVLIGMQRPPHDDLRDDLSLIDRPSGIDNQTAHRLKVQLAEQLRQQLTIGAPTNTDERTLRQLAEQLRAKKVIVKLFLRHSLHAKLYLLFRNDPINPIVGYLGSSNLTFAGLSSQGELNMDVLDQDATVKLKQWFEDRWNDRFCVDITDELLEIIEESWAREALIPPYHVYLKMAYHLSHEARAGLAEFRIPKVFGDRLFDFQAAAVKIAAHHLNKRNGVLIGDVVGLGKTLMATAVARIFEDDYGLETLIICPKNLVPMWEDYAYEYQLRAKVLSLSRVLGELPTLRRYRIVVIDESHNLRNREGKRYRAIQEYVRENESKCILLSATPYKQDVHGSVQPTAHLRGGRPGPGHPPGTPASGFGRGGVRPPPSSRSQDVGSLRLQRTRRRLARPDAPLLGAPHPQLHPGQLCRDGPRDWSEVPHLRGWDPLFLPDTRTEDGQVRHRRRQPRRPVRQAVLVEGGRHSEGPLPAQVRSRQLLVG